MADDKKKDNVIQFPRPIQFDSDGIPNAPRAVVYGVQCIERGHVKGVMLFVEKDIADKVRDIAKQKAMDAGQQRYFDFVREDYPIY